MKLKTGGNVRTKLKPGQALRGRPAGSVARPIRKNHPHPPSPIESKRLFYTTVSLFLSHIQGYHYQFPKSILSMKSLRGPMCCIRGRTLFSCKSLRDNQGVPGQDKNRAKSEEKKKKRKKNVSKLIWVLVPTVPVVNNANFHPGGPSNNATINTYFWSMHNN